MPLSLDIYPHSQLRYTVRLKYICPIYGELVTDYLFMSEEEYEDSFSYRRKLEGKMEEINTGLYDGDVEIDGWESVDEIKNSFYDSEIFSDAVLSLLKDGKVSSINDNATEEDIKLALYYLYYIQDQYSKARVKKEIDNLPFTPLKNIVDRILSIWNTSTKAKKQKNGTIETARSKQDQELSRLLNEKYKESLETFRKDLHKLNEQWGIRTEKDNYRRSVIIAKSLCDYPATKGLPVGFSKGMRVLSEYFNVTLTSYKRRVLIPSSEVLDILSKPQRAFQEQIKEPWKEFISKF